MIFDSGTDAVPSHLCHCVALVDLRLPGATSRGGLSTGGVTGFAIIDFCLFGLVHGW